MNKIKLFFLAAILVVAAGSANAQKTGYIKVDDVVALLPETRKLQGALEKYNADSLLPRYNYTLSEFQRKDSLINGKDSLKYSAGARMKMREEMQQDLYELQNWQQISSQAIQARQDQLLEPLYRRAFEAIQAVAKENGYSYVYTKDALLVAPPADDLLPMVAKRLNLKLPNAGNAGQGRPAAPTAKPATQANAGKKQ